ncbi:MAG TPA: hypothetical protein VFP25_05210 [Nitrososphaeraceae archaeon]|nr:hypothetical protein [Nitrososphaeraceae archaeon]
MNTILIYLRLEGTLSNLVIFEVSEIIIVKRIAIDLQVESEIVTVAILLE